MITDCFALSSTPTSKCFGSSLKRKTLSNSRKPRFALTRLLNLDLIAWDASLDLTAYAGAVYIDHQGGTCTALAEALNAAEVPLLIVVDHHEPQNVLTPEYSDIQKTGSTATIYAQYIEQGLLQMQKSRKEHVAVATALMHGIMTDTQNFIRATGEDLRAAAYLSRFRDADLLEQIMAQARSKHAMDIILRALENRQTIENFSVAGIGYVRAEDRDAIPQAADFLMTEENVHTAIVYGLIAVSTLMLIVVLSLSAAWRWHFRMARSKLFSVPRVDGSAASRGAPRGSVMIRFFSRTGMIKHLPR